MNKAQRQWALSLLLLVLAFASSKFSSISQADATQRTAKIKQNLGYTLIVNMDGSESVITDRNGKKIGSIIIDANGKVVLKVFP